MSPISLATGTAQSLAPIEKGARIGSLTVTAPGIPAVSYPLVAGADVAELGFFGRAMAAVSSLVERAVN